MRGIPSSCGSGGCFFFPYSSSFKNKNYWREGEELEGGKKKKEALSDDCWRAQGYRMALSDAILLYFPLKQKSVVAALPPPPDRKEN